MVVGDMSNIELYKLLERFDRVAGSLVGLAIGDAIGLTQEFELQSQISPITDMIGGGVYNLEPGVWSDTTSMAFALADSLVEDSVFNPAYFMKRLDNWYNNGHYSANDLAFHVNGTVMKALTSFREKGFRIAENEHYISDNGSLGRLVPIACRYHNNLDIAIGLAKLQSKVTHSTQICLMACESFAEMLIHAYDGFSKKIILEKLIGSIGDLIYNDNRAFNTLKLATWAIMNTDNFSDAVLLVANQGGNASSNTAVVGALAGALYGYSNIRPDWLEKLSHQDSLVYVAGVLFDIGNLNNDLPVLDKVDFSEMDLLRKVA